MQKQQHQHKQKQRNAKHYSVDDIHTKELIYNKSGISTL